MTTQATDYRAVLRNHFKKPGAALRPVFTNLNGDSAWLISFPRPPTERRATGKAYYHVVQDPFLNGGGPVINTLILWLAVSWDPAIGSPAAIEDVIAAIESAAAGGKTINSKPTIDCIVVSTPAPDHAHPPTLIHFSPDIPIVASTDGAAKMVQGMNRFQTIITHGEFEASKAATWTDLHPGTPLPEWLHVMFLKSERSSVNWAIAWIIAHPGEKNELIISTPHGLMSTDATIRALIDDASPPVETLAIMYPLKESWTFGTKFVLGVTDGLDLYEGTKAKYWLQNADGVFRYWGLLYWFVNDIFTTMDIGLEEKSKAEGKNIERPNFVAMENGGCYILE